MDPAEKRRLRRFLVWTTIGSVLLGMGFDALKHALSDPAPVEPVTGKRG